MTETQFNNNNNHKEVYFLKEMVKCVLFKVCAVIYV